MAIVFGCPACNARLEVHDETAGTKMKCPKCSALVLVPEYSSAVPASSAPNDYEDEQRPPKKRRKWLIPVLICFGALMVCCGPATLIGLLVPAVQQVREAAARTATMNNMSQCAKAAHLAHDQFKTLPPYYGPYGNKDRASSFHTHLLPYVDQSPLYNLPTPDPQAVVPTYMSFMDPTVVDNNGFGGTNFPVNLRLFYTKGGLGELGTEKKDIYPNMPKSFPDGVSMTLLFATKYYHCGAKGGSLWADTNAPSSPNAATFGLSLALWQQAPTQANCNPTVGTAVSFSPVAIQVALCDASVRNVPVGVSPATWQALHTPGAGDIPGNDWGD